MAKKTLKRVAIRCFEFCPFTRPVEGDNRFRFANLRAAYLLIAICAIWWPVSIWADDSGNMNSGHPYLPAVTVATPPIIDGIIDDVCWKQATHISDFRREKIDAPALEPTEAWICCDERAIYVAFQCHDSLPEEISCDQRKRQGRIRDDDRVLFSVDVQDQGHSFYEFYVTPAGTQYDSVPGGTSEKIEWKGDWRASAHTDESGWSAEMEVPFSILRYPSGQRTFRFYLARILERAEDWATWPPDYARIWDTENCARWTDISTPEPPFRYVVMPYALTVLSEYEDDREALMGGLDLKGTWPNGVVALGTYNPDFRNLEDVVDTLDFTYVERRLPEYRPFFQEGRQYLPSSDLFYSRRVEELDFGVKSFGAVGAHRFAFLDTYRRGGENHLAWRYDHLFGTSADIRLSAVDRRVPEEPHNLAYRIEGNLQKRFEGGDQWIGGAVDWSQTDGAGGEDTRFRFWTGVDRNEGFGWFAGYHATGVDFRADDGYVPETGVRMREAGIDYHRSYDEGPLQWIETHLHGHEGDSEDGTRRDYWFGHDWHWRSGRSLWLGISSGERDGFDQLEQYIGGCWNRKDVPRKGSAGYNWGDFYGYPYHYFYLEQAVHATDQWSTHLRAERVYAADLDDAGDPVPAEWSRQIVVTTTYDLTDERTISARFVHGGGNTNAYAAYRQRVRRGMDLLVLAGDPNADEWVSRLAVKAIWCF